MSIAKVIELMAEGDSIEDAVSQAVITASKTVRNIKSVYVKNIQAIIHDGKISKYRLDVKVSFVIE